MTIKYCQAYKKQVGVLVSPARPGCDVTEWVMFPACKMLKQQLEQWKAM